MWNFNKNKPGSKDRMFSVKLKLKANQDQNVVLGFPFQICINLQSLFLKKTKKSLPLHCFYLVHYSSADFHCNKPLMIDFFQALVCAFWKEDDLWKHSRPSSARLLR